MEPSATASVHSSTAHGICTITFFHPQSNSLPRQILDELAQAVTAAGKDQSHCVVVLQSAGNRAFCAGASFDELMAIKTPAEGFIFFSGFSEVIQAIKNCPLLVICRVQGKAVGGGVGIAAAADYTFATQHASIKLSELAIGIGPFVVGPAVERKLGTASFSALAIDATSWRTAHWAHTHGLYAEVFDDAESMDQAIADLANRLASSSPDAMAELKRTFWKGTEDWADLLEERAATSGRLVLSEFTRAAIAKFKKS
jgi:methylglutaconyl-CoA hydratase